MTDELKQAWIDALKSGEFQQGYGFLKRAEKFCCLGVLCEVMIARGANITRRLTDDEQEEDKLITLYSGERSLLSEELLNLAGLSWDEQIVVMHKNDDTRSSFDEIAAYLKRNKTI